MLVFGKMHAITIISGLVGNWGVQELKVDNIIFDKG